MMRNIYFTYIYFYNNLLYIEHYFERRFRMPRHLLQRINQTLRWKGLFVHHRDDTGRLGIHPEPRIITALHIIANGMSTD